MKTYTIVSIVDRRTGEPTERHYRRSGHRIEVVWLSEGEPMILRYIDQGSVLTTSGVWNHQETDGLLVVKTKNSIYTFKREETK